MEIVLITGENKSRRILEKEENRAHQREKTVQGEEKGERRGGGRPEDGRAKGKTRFF